MTVTDGPAVPIVPEPSGSGPVEAAAGTAPADFAAWEQQFPDTSRCSHPVLLSGTVTATDRDTGQTAEVYKTWTTVELPAAPPRTETVRVDSPLYTDCGNRRESVCPHCSAIYKRDARQLVRSGLAGGKGVPESVSAHPCVFLTLTAPSFGPVHARRMRGKTVLPCRPRRDASKRVCPHGRDISCPVRHSPDDPRLGRPMCGDCYDYEAAVLFNFHATTLWRRFTTYLPRHLARLAGVPVKMARAEVSVSFVKVAEYQVRGVVHFHAVARLDANVKDAFLPPPSRYTAALLCDAVTLAARAVRLTVPGSGPRIRLGFGRQLDVRPIWREDFAASGRALDVQAVANYIAKYASKAADVPGLPDTRIRHVSEIDVLHCPAHHKRMVRTAWVLGGRTSAGGPRLRLWAHMLGYSGHFLTKSRRYSVTFGQLRRARAEHRKLERYPDGQRDPWGRPLDETVVLVLKDFTYTGSGDTPRTPGAELALASADRARANRQNGRFFVNQFLTSNRAFRKEG